MSTDIFTIGHSSLEYESFLALLRGAEINAIADVRSSPYSRNEQFNREALKKNLESDNISYVYLGTELGGRPSNTDYYCEGIADYEKMSGDEKFKLGIERVLSGAKKYKVALMCSEHSPFDCHRCLLVGRALLDAGMSVHHILSTGKQLSQKEVEQKLVEDYGKGADDLFVSSATQISNAYRERSRQVAYRNTDPNKGPVAA